MLSPKPSKISFSNKTLFERTIGPIALIEPAEAVRTNRCAPVKVPLWVPVSQSQ